MKKTIINKANNKSCILFFNGWGMDENAISHLDCTGFDVIMFNNYQTIESLQEDLTAYNYKILIAWSLGVWAAERSLSSSEIMFDKSIAINGTSYPVDDIMGIPVKVFQGTMDSWNDSNRERFNMRMMGGKEAFNLNKKYLSGIPVNEQKNELMSLYNNFITFEALQYPKKIKWDIVLIGNKDLIFTANNQINYWNEKAKIIRMDFPHFPFAEFESWNEIVNIDI